jgi:tRNA-binding protein
MSPSITWADFERVDIRAGTILEAREFPQARKPAYQLLLDFGPEIGTKKSSAQITHHYTPATLVGVPDPDGHIVLTALANPAPNGARLM